MSKYTSTDHTFKYFMIGILIVATLLIVGIVALSVKNSQNIKLQELPTALQESVLNRAASMRYGSSENEEEYFVYFYSPNCGHCQVLMESNAYQRYIENPKIRMYKLNIAEEESLLIANEIGLVSTPTIIYIKKISDGKYIIDTMSGSEEPQNSLIQFTK